MKSLRILPVLLALALPVAGQQPAAPEEPASIFGETIDVRVVNVEVVVTDRQGNRVSYAELLRTAPVFAGLIEALQKVRPEH